MAIPYQVQGLTAEQADGSILLKWSTSLSATSYIVQRGDDPNYFNFTQFTNLEPNIPQYLDQSPGTGQQFYYRVAAQNDSGQGPWSSTASMVAAPPSEMSLYELRLRAQQTADRVNSNFVTTTEWNAFLRLGMYELYDLLIGSYEDYYASSLVYITTNGSQQYYPLPDGVYGYPGGNYSPLEVTFVIAPYFPQGITVTVTSGDVYQNNGYLFTVSTTGADLSNFNASGNGIPLPNGLLTKVSGDATSPDIITYTSFNANVTGATGEPAPAFYKLSGMDLAVNTSTVNPAWVTLKKFNFIDRNKYIYPNSTSTIYGVYNQAYRIMGQQVQLIPVPAGNQTIRMWYAPRLPALLKDSDLTTLGFSGWLRYPIVRAAKYALDKEEGSDTSKLDTEIVFLKQRIQEMASNRDQGAPDTISETRRDGVYGGTGWGNGMGGGNAGW